MKDLYSDIALDMVKNDGVDNVRAFDPMTILAIIQIVAFIIGWVSKLLDTPADIQRSVSKLNFMQRFFMKMKLRQTLRGYYDPRIFDASMRNIVSTTPEKLQEIL